MKAKLSRLALLVFVLASGIEGASAQIYNGYIYGDWGFAFLVGSNLFNNPLQSSSNDLSQLFLAQTTPVGTTVSLWNPTNSSFDKTSTFTNGLWSVDMALPPGSGALVIAPSPFTNTIIGYVLDHTGTPITNNAGLALPPPPVFSGQNGVYLLGDKAPVVDVGTNIFLNILGRMPFVGEQVTILSGTSTYLGNGIWDSIPTLRASEAAFLNVMTEPSPLLSIACAKNQAIVSWPSSPSRWTLQTNSDLATGSWCNYAGPVVNNTVTNPPSAGNLFFRLSYP